MRKEENIFTKTKLLCVLFFFTVTVSFAQTDLKTCLGKENYTLLVDGIASFEEALKKTYSSSKPIDSLYILYTQDLTRLLDIDQPIFKHQTSIRFLQKLKQKGKLSFFWTKDESFHDQDTLDHYKIRYQLENYYINKGDYLKCLESSSQTKDMKLVFETMNAAQQISYSVVAGSLYLPRSLEMFAKNKTIFKALVAFHFYYEIILNYSKIE